jgi:4-hydroxymandelate oxidase
LAPAWPPPIEAGAAGVIVSNHGGRQLDGAVATAQALPEVAQALAGRGEVLVDEGVRSGRDVRRALALGARAVLLGRPVLWGLATEGAAGVQRVLTELQEDTAHALALAGACRVAEVTADLIARP